MNILVISLFCVHELLYQPHGTEAAPEAEKQIKKMTLNGSQTEAKNSSLFICLQITQFSVLQVLQELSGTQHLPIAMYLCGWPPEC